MLVFKVWGGICDSGFDAKFLKRLVLIGLFHIKYGNVTCAKS